MNLQRKNIEKLKPYTSARDLYKEGIFLDANENYQQWIDIDWRKMQDLNRYPESDSLSVRRKIVEKYLKDFTEENVFFGSGSDEIIDLIIRGFVEDDEYVMVMNPSYSIYNVQAEINNKKVKSVLLNNDLSLNISEIKENIDGVKVIFLCSPNNPTGNLISIDEIKQIMEFFDGLVVIDEAYIEYAGMENSLIGLVKKNKKIMILRTFSKAWGLAGIRAGYLVGSKEIVQTLLKIKDSYNASKLTQEIVLQALDQIGKLSEILKDSKNKKIELENNLKKLGIKCIPTKANFVLAKLDNANDEYKSLTNEGVIVRDRSNLPYLGGVLRITVGTDEENSKLLKILGNIS